MDSHAIKMFFDRYYQDYNRLSQTEETIDELDAYWKNDIRVVSYTPGPDGRYPQIFSNREQWKRFLNIIHGFFDEILEPQEYLIDQDQNCVVVKARIINRHKGTPQIISETDGVGIYRVDGAAGSPQISQIEIYFGDPRQLRKAFRGLGKMIKFVRLLRTL